MQIKAIPVSVIQFRMIDSRFSPNGLGYGWRQSEMCFMFWNNGKQKNDVIEMESCGTTSKTAFLNRASMFFSRVGFNGSDAYSSEELHQLTEVIECHGSLLLTHDGHDGME
ncbi:hypothetical protein TNCV_2704641 [Trichonephila clavipes]|nr:hypothetical protein TNCV_2704641 [Trichonephila clavipes]